MRTIVLGFLIACVVLVRPLGAQDAPLSKIEPVSIATEAGAALFTIEIADTDALRERGLMFRQRLPEDRGMLFDYGEPQSVAMWMKNTYVSLDMVFIRADGTVAYVAENTVPHSLDAIGVRPSEPEERRLDAIVRDGDESLFLDLGAF